MKFLMIVLSFLTLFAAFITADDFSDKQIDSIVQFVSNLDENVTWPKNHRTEGGDELFVVSVLGKTSVSAKMIGLNTKKTSAGHKIKVRLVSVDLLPSNSNVIVISSQDKDEIKKVLKMLKGTGTLTITLGKDFGKLGSMVNFYIADENGQKVLKYELNMNTINEEKLVFKEDIVQLAEKIE